MSQVKVVYLNAYLYILPFSLQPYDAQILPLGIFLKFQNTVCGEKGETKVQPRLWTLKLSAAFASAVSLLWWCATSWSEFCGCACRAMSSQHINVKSVCPCPPLQTPLFNSRSIPSAQSSNFWSQLFLNICKHPFRAALEGCLCNERIILALLTSHVRKSLILWVFPLNALFLVCYLAALSRTRFFGYDARPLLLPRVCLSLSLVNSFTFYTYNST
jgi:hypothetical protein